MSNPNILYQASFISFSSSSGNPETLLALFKPASRVLVINKSIKYTIDRKLNDGIFISNDSSCDDFDFFFKNDDVRDAINAFYQLSSTRAKDGSSRCLIFSNGMERFNPERSIEAVGLDDRGTVYSIAPDVSSGQLAVLAICLSVSAQPGILSALSMSEDLLSATGANPMGDFENAIFTV